MHINVRSILTNEKFDDFQTFIYSTGKHWSVICLTETWLDPFTEQYRHLPGYTSIFSSRPNKTGGGVAMYICNKCISSTSPLKINKIDETESLFVESTVQSKQIVLGVVYRPPRKAI